VVSEGVSLFFLQLAFLLLFLLLALNDAQEVVTFSLSLVGHSGFALQELAFAGNLKFFGLSLLLLFLGDLLSAGLTFLLFEGTLGTERIDLRLSISSLLLHFSETSDFSLLLLLLSAFLEGLGDFTGNLLLVVTDNFLLFIDFLLAELLLLGEGDGVGSLNLSNKLKVTLTLGFGSSDLSLALVLDLAGHLLLFLLKHLALLDTLDFTLLDLVDNNDGTLATSLHADLLTLLGDLETLKSLDFHHEVQLLLLLDPLGFKLFVFVQLLVTNSHNF
jgi:hypothetical protein